MSDIVKLGISRWPWLLLAVIVIAAAVAIGLAYRPKTVTVSGYQVSIEAATATQRYQEGKFSEAITAYEAALKKHPGDWFSWNGLANAKRELLDWTGAEAGYKKALALNPRFEQGYRNLAQLYYRWSEEDDNKLGGVEPVLLRGIKILPVSLIILDELVHYYRKVGDQATADKYAELLAQT